MLEKFIRYLLRLLGIICILFSFHIFMENKREDLKAYEASSAISEKISAQKTNILVASEDYSMPVDFVDGVGYIGQLIVPNKNFILPIAAEYTFKQMYKTPTLYQGSYYSNDMVICAHNYKNHFSFLGSVKIGEEVIFETVDGQVYRYLITNREIVQPTDFDSIKKQKNNDWDLTLFTCTQGGTQRIMIRCQRTGV